MGKAEEVTATEKEEVEEVVNQIMDKVVITLINSSNILELVVKTCNRFNYLKVNSWRNSDRRYRTAKRLK